MIRKQMETKEEQLNFIINKLDWLIGLEFIDKDEISSCRRAIRILKKELIK